MPLDKTAAPETDLDPMTEAFEDRLWTIAETAAAATPMTPSFASEIAADVIAAREAHRAALTASRAAHSASQGDAATFAALVRLDMAAVERRLLTAFAAVRA